MSWIKVLFQTVWVLVLGGLGLIIGAAAGYTNGGPIGALFMGAMGYLLGASIAVAGRAGLMLLIELFT